MVRFKRFALGLTSVLSLVSGAATAGAQHMGKRATTAADIGGFRGAVLVKNGKIASCELALIDEKAAYVAASCLNYNDDLSLDKDSVYEIYFDGGDGSKRGSTVINNDLIHLHPQYNADSFANNIAVVEFNPPDSTTWDNPIAAYPSDWNDTAYVLRAAQNDENTWTTPAIYSQAGPDSGCTVNSALYKSNTNYMLCIKSSTRTTVQGASCTMPYTSAYGVGKSGMAVSALLSYSISSTDTMCDGSSNQYNYYTVLTFYDLFAQSVLGRSVGEYVENSSSLASLGRSASFQMNSVSLDGDVHVFSGDMLDLTNLFETIVVVNPATKSGVTSTFTVVGTSTQFIFNDGQSGSDGASATDAAGDDVEQDDSDTLESDKASYQSMPKTTIIGLAVGIPVGAIIVAVIIFLVVSNLKKRKQRLQWSNNTERRQKDIRELYDELGGASPEKDDLPGYDELRHSYMMRNSLAPAPAASGTVRDMRSHSILFSDVYLGGGASSNQIYAVPSSDHADDPDLPPPIPYKN
ncbi:hypothetical protein LPJ53_003648 [Coemansia erecta]|uniref:Peptidase S1 domain-containing protein n=1 Tax=Coemansia erecta TaxID=147472 RepID=A0A9W7Y0Q2_9FUNG|nr:hypothetical protein LPJ53_003648 [Coemansia erecta]